MFGHQDDHQDHHDQESADNLIPAPTIDGILSNDAHPGGGTAVVSNQHDQPAPAADHSFNPALPPTDNQPGDDAATPNDDVSSSKNDDNHQTSAPALEDQSSDPNPDAGAHGDVDANGLLDIKQQALTELTPLVGHLEQSPEEKFRTTMMMIQANDNQALISTAYEAAQAIPDEKAKAQALLDIVNEINYFTQHHAA